MLIRYELLDIVIFVCEQCSLELPHSLKYLEQAGASSMVEVFGSVSSVDHGLSRM